MARTMRGSEFVTLVRQFGWEMVEHKANRAQFLHEDGRSVSLHLQLPRELNPALVTQMLQRFGLPGQSDTLLRRGQPPHASPDTRVLLQWVVCLAREVTRLRRHAHTLEEQVARYRGAGGDDLDRMVKRVPRLTG